MIATHNNVALLRRCLAAWEAHAPSRGVELVVIADGCTDETHEYLQSLQATEWGSRVLRWVVEDDVHELRCTNRGLREARGALAMSWHDDMFLTSSWMVPEIIETFDTYPEIGLLALSRGLLCAPYDAPMETWLDTIDWRRLQSTVGPAPLNWLRLAEVDGVVRPWVVRRACIDRVGPLDERYHLTEWDESDLCFRIRNAGWRVAVHGYERGGAYTHLLSSSFGKQSQATREALGLLNARRFYERWSGQIARDHPRERRTWWRRMHAASGLGLAVALLHAARIRMRPGTSLEPGRSPTMKALAKRLVWAALPGRLQHAIAARRYGFYRPRVQLKATISDTPGALRLDIATLKPLVLPESMREDVDFHFRLNGASMEEMYSLVQVATPGAILFDIGAHCGLFAHVFCAARDDTRVVAFEPGHTLRAVCSEVAAANGFGDRIIVEGAAVGSYVGVVRGSVQANGFAAFDVEDGATATDFMMTTVDAECARLGVVPTVLKIDVEGYEQEVLIGARQLLADHGPLLLLELHVTMLAQRGQHVRHIVRELAALGYAFFDHSGAPLSVVKLGATRSGVVRCLARRA